MSFLHITHIKNDVMKFFDTITDVSDINKSNPDFEANKLSRELAAYAIYSLCGSNPSEIAKYITDGGDDNGIDCFYYDNSKSVMYFSQAKWDQDGSGIPSQADVKKFTDGIRDLVSFKFDRFNEKLTKYKSYIEDIFKNPEVKYVAVLVYTGANDLAKHEKREFDDLLKEMNDSGDLLSVEILNQARLHSNISKKFDNNPINLTISLKNFGKIEKPYKAFYGQLNGTYLSNWWDKYHTNLFSKNIRSILGNTDVNSEMRDTINSTPELFWFFNNGITIIADTITKTIEGGGDTDIGNFTCSNVSVINGAQTISSIGCAGVDKPENVSNVYVQCRLIESGSINNEISDRITRTNNRQNKIENRDFLSQDPQQKRIRSELLPEGYNYEIQRSESSIKDTYSIDLTEATVALACASYEPSLFVQAKREIGKLWEDVSKTPYLRLFNPSTNSLDLLRKVLIQREIDKAISTLINDPSISSYEKAFYNYGNRMISARVFKDIPTSKLVNPQFDFNSFLSDFDFKATIKTYHDKLLNIVDTYYPNSVIGVFFKNLKKCTDVFEKL